MKQNIREVIIVEGKTDTVKLKSLFNVDTIETNGSHLKKQTISLIQQAALHRGVILFLDPDGVGEAIRRKLENSLVEFKQAFIRKTDVVKGRKIGVAEANDLAIVNALKSAITFTKLAQSIDWNDYLFFDMNAMKRKIVTDYFKISESNNKQLFKRLNMMGITPKMLKEVFISCKDRQYGIRNS
ncbi:MAG: ribonuclease M5 [Mycoplasmataceae bacterium]|nr:ribonuclease M5 [Mycoplasmataceae bacterium]